MNHHFELKSWDTEKEASIRYRVHFNGVRFVYGTGLLIYPELWDKINMRPTIDRSRIKEYRMIIPDIEVRLRNINVRLANVINVVETYVNSCKLESNLVDLKLLKAKLNDSVKKADKAIKPDTKTISSKNLVGKKNLDSINTYLEEFIFEIRSGRRTIPTGKSKGNRYSLGTIKNYVGLLEHLKRYENNVKRQLYWKDLSLDFYNKFINDCNVNNLKRNYIGRLIKQIKVVAQAAFDDEIHNNIIFRDRRFETINEKVMNIALDDDELNKLQSIDLSNNPNLESVRDIFLAGCYTAQRWSDYSKISKNQITGNNLILIQKKTKQKVVIPVSKRLREIIQKYPNGFNNISEPAFNRLIKKVAKMARIDGNSEIKETIGGNQQTKRYERCELISSHTARRTGATIMYKEKIPTLAIMKLTGHKTESSFLKYICISEEENAGFLEQYPFFEK